MQAPSVTRRSFLTQSLVIAGPMVAATTSPTCCRRVRSGATRALKVCCIGAHPDDPESGCAGTLARYAQLGHSVTVVYLTRGERGIRGKSYDEAASIRSQESIAACEVIGAKPVFFGQINGATEVNNTQVDAMSRLVAGLAPDVVFTHWPMNTHMDHQAASILAIRACMALPQTPRLFFFEVNTGSQSRGFLPNTYVERLAGAREEKGRLACPRESGWARDLAAAS